MTRPECIKRIVICVLSLCGGLAACLGGVDGTRRDSAAGGRKDVAKPSGVAPAEKSGWKLVFADRFDRDELGPNWIVVEGNWTVANGSLRGSGTLVSARGFPSDDLVGFQRLEFEAVTDVRPIIFFPNKPKPRVVVCDISPFLHAGPPEKGKSPLKTGYFFQFGGMNNSLNQIRRLGQRLLVDEHPKKLITQDQMHRFVVENDKGRLRLFVDGIVVLEHKEKMSLVGPKHNRLGFYFYTAAKMRDVKVYVKELPNGLDLE